MLQIRNFGQRRTDDGERQRRHFLNVEDNGATVSSVSDTAGLIGMSCCRQDLYIAIGRRPCGRYDRFSQFSDRPLTPSMRSASLAPIHRRSQRRGTARQRNGLGNHQQCGRLNIGCLSFWRRRQPKRRLWLDHHPGRQRLFLSEYQVVSATQAGLVATAPRVRTAALSMPS